MIRTWKITVVVKEYITVQELRDVFGDRCSWIGLQTVSFERQGLSMDRALQWTCSALRGRRWTPLDIRAKLIGEDSSVAFDNHRKNPIISTDVATGREEHFESLLAATKALNGPRRHISMCLHGKRRTAYGRTWRYANDAG